MKRNKFFGIGFLAIAGMTAALSLTGCADLLAALSSGGSSSGSSSGGIISESEASDPSQWTAVANPDFNVGYLSQIAFGNGVFVTGGDAIAYSSDGISWTKADVNGVFTAPPTEKEGYTIKIPQFIIDACIGGKFFAHTEWNEQNKAFGNESSYFGGKAYSEDGATWIREDNTSAPICYGGGIFLSKSGGELISYSSDAINWARIPPIGDFGSSISAAAYGDGTFAAVNGRGKLYSKDGVNWTFVPGETTTRQARDGTPIIQMIDYTSAGIVYGSGRFAAFGTRPDANGSLNPGESTIAYSTDGANWTTASDIPFGATKISNITYGNGVFVAFGMSKRRAEDAIIAYSTDGQTWSVVESFSFGNIGISNIVFGGGKFVTYGTQYVRTDIRSEGNVLIFENKMAYSADGASWTEVDDLSAFGSDGGIRAIAYGNGRFVAV